MAKKSGYLQRWQAEIDTIRLIERETYIQFMTDTLSMTLNDPKVMGKDVFGKDRLTTVIRAWGQKFNEFHPALVKSDDADYYQIKLDQRLTLIFGDEIERFGERYKWLQDLT